MTAITAGRDAAQLNRLLSAARGLGCGEISLALLCGRYREADRLLGEEEADIPRQQQRAVEEHEERYSGCSDATALAEAYSAGVDYASYRERTASVRALRGLIPAEDAPGAQALWDALQALLSSPLDNASHVRDRLDRFLQGVESAGLPAQVEDLKKAIRGRMSLEVRRRAVGRPGAPVEAGRAEEAELWSLYHLPGPALEPLRRRLTYAQFLDRAEKELGSWARQEGPSPPQRARLVGRMGLWERHLPLPGEDTLVDLLRAHGGLLARIGWFRDAECKVKEERTIVLAGIEGAPGERRFLSLECALPHEVCYTMAELADLADSIVVVSGAVQPASARGTGPSFGVASIERWLDESRSG